MALKTPRFIQDANIQGGAVDVPWDRQVFRSLEDYRSKNLQTALLKIAPHANLAYAIGVAEWVCRRLTSATDCGPTLDYIEGIWAAMVDRRYLAKKKMDYVKFTWTDGAVDAIRFVNNLLFLVYANCKGDNPDRTADTSQLVAVARHVLPDKRVFDQWATESLKRLTALFGYEKELGPAVPRQTLEPTLSYDPKRRIEYLDEFLKGLSPDRNPFLAKAADLVAQGFTGAPYRLTE